MRGCLAAERLGSLRPCGSLTTQVRWQRDSVYKNGMEILAPADVGPLLIVALSVASFVTAFIGVFTGAAGGVILLAIMAMVMPPAAVIPVHTVVMLGTGISRTVIMWRFVMRGTLLPFIAGAAVGAAIGSKLVAWAERPGETWAHATELAWLLGGKSIVGGLLGGLAGVEIAKKMAGETRSTGDLFVLPLCLGIAIGRIGCFLAGLADETFGLTTSLPWGVDFGDGARRHPTQIYEILVLGLIAWWAAARQRAMPRSGDLFRGFMLLYLAFRLAIETIKPGPRAYLGLTGVQVACVLGLLYYVRDVRRVFVPGSVSLG